MAVTQAEVIALSFGKVLRILDQVDDGTMEDRRALDELMEIRAEYEKWEKDKGEPDPRAEKAGTN